MLLIPRLRFSVAVYLFILFIVKRDRGSKEPITALFAAMALAYSALFLQEITKQYFCSGVLLLIRLVAKKLAVFQHGNFTAALTVGLIEESVKAIPLAIYIYKKHYLMS